MVQPDNLPPAAAPRAPSARERLRLMLDRGSLVIISLSTLYWAWVRISTSDAIRGTRALAIPGTLVLLIVGCFLAWRAASALRAMGKVLVLAAALFWLASFYNTGGHHVYFLGRELPLANLYKLALCATVCFTLSYFLALVLQVFQKYPQHVSRVLFSIGVLVVVFVSIDLWFCIDPPVEPAMVGEFLYVKQYHPVFTYAVQDTYVTRDARERVVRDYQGTTFNQTKPSDVVRIVLSGASTVWGHGLSGPQTLRTQVESKLRTRVPEKKWEVICVAYQGKYQLNELVDTVSVLPQWDPDLVIGLNGYNETWYGETPGRYFGQPFIDDQTKLTFGETLWARLTHLGPVLFAMERKPQLITETDIDPEIPPLYYNQLRLSARALKGLGIPYAYSFCPNVFELPDAHENERSLRNRLDQSAAGDQRPKSVVVRERRLASATIIQEEGQITFDVMELLKDIPASRFIDECHLTADATEVLADRLVESIPWWLLAR
jgi:hypothetical protein